MWRVEFFKIGKRDVAFIREMRVHTVKSKVKIFSEYMNFNVTYGWYLKVPLNIVARYGSRRHTN